MSDLYILFALGVALLAVIYDLKFRIIPNWLTLGSLILIIILSWLFGETASLREHSLGAILVGGIWLIFWRFKIMGGGDQKLMATLGAAIGLNLAPYLMLAVAIFGGIISLIFMLGNNKYKFNNIWSQKKLPVPYSLAILAGLILVAFFVPACHATQGVCGQAQIVFKGVLY